MKKTFLHVGKKKKNREKREKRKGERLKKFH